MTIIGEMEATARKAIMKAGDLIRERIGTITPSLIEAKGPSDYVTVVDRQCEEMIVETILDRFPDHGIMAEETAGGFVGDGFTWIIDPIDGTTNFIHGFPFVAVSIAVCEDGKQVLGYVLDPIRGELFRATRGAGAFLNDRPIHVRRVSLLNEALVATGFPFRTRNIFEPYLSVFRSVFHNVSGLRRAGSAALDLAYVAAGRVDGFWEPGLATWDIAAGSLIILEAGGMVDDFWEEGEYLRRGHIVAGADPVFRFLMEQVKSHLAPALESEKTIATR